MVVSLLCLLVNAGGAVAMTTAPTCPPASFPPGTPMGSPFTKTNVVNEWQGCNRADPHDGTGSCTKTNVTTNGPVSPILVQHSVAFPGGPGECVNIILVQFGGVSAATFHPRFRHDSPTSLPACREPTGLGAASLDRYSDILHS